MEKLELTSLNTVKGENFPEMTVNIFLEKIDNGISKKYSIETENNKIIITFNGIKYYFEIDDNNKGYYAINYNSFISKLQNRILLKKLKKDQKFSLKEYFKNLKSDLKQSSRVFPEKFSKIEPFSQMLSNGPRYFFKNTMSGLVIAMVTEFIAVGMFNAPLSPIIERWWMFLGLVPFSPYLVPIATFLGSQITRRIDRLTDFIYSRRETNEQIQKLLLEMNREYLDSYKPNICEAEIFSKLEIIIEKIKNIDNSKRKEFIEELIEIKKTYEKELKKIRKNDLEFSEDNDLEIDVQTLMTLLADTLYKVEQLSEKIDQTIKVGVSNIETDAHLAKLDEKIELLLGDHATQKSPKFLLKGDGLQDEVENTLNSEETTHKNPTR